MKPSFSFSKIKQISIEQYFDITEQIDVTQFETWFSFQYVCTNEAINFLRYLLDLHGVYLKYYNERQLQAQFISPILNKVNFKIKEKGIRDWYESSLSHEFDKVILTGVTDYMVATGRSEPELPCFFIQEFKQSASAGHPSTQLLAELIVALAHNKTSMIRGAYIVGQYWNFVILEKTVDSRYYYYTSRGFDSSIEEDLTQIYINLQAVKHKYCNIPLTD